MTKYITIDFETHGIEERPKFPPEPVGVAIYCCDGEHMGEPAYLSWGHPTKNNCTKLGAIQVLKDALEDPTAEFIFHNAPFDCAIIEERLGLKVPWSRVHDTMVMAFLQDPFGELSLKPLAAQWLQMSPEERDAVKDWLIANGKCRDTKGWGAHIWQAPGDLVGQYAIGDVVRTYQLFELFKEYLEQTNMWDAYRREVDLMPHILKMEQRGLNLDGEALQKDTDYYFEMLDQLDADICKLLGAEIDIDSNAQLADAIEAAGMSKGFLTTPTGQRSTAKESLIGAINNPTLLGHLLVRGSVATCLRTFMTSWLQQYKAHGRLYVKWNQVRNYSDTGARTGRLSSSPNLQNCLEGDTEVLTPYGWVRLDALPDICEVAQYDNGEISFAQPSRVLRQDYIGPLLEFNGRNHTLSYTPEHRVLAKPFGHGAFEELSAQDITAACDWVIPVAGTYAGGAGIFSSLAAARLFVAIRADGCWKASSIEFGFKRIEKMQRLRSLLQILGISWNEHVSTNGANYFNLHVHPVCTELRAFATKHYAAWVLQLTAQERTIMLDEEQYWDGHAIGDRIRVDSNIYEDCYWLQIMAVLDNRACSYAKTLHGWYVSYAQPGNASLGFRPGPKTLTTKQHIGKVYCVTVPSGFFVVRRKNVVHITGNCPVEWEGLRAQLAKIGYVLPFPLPQVRKYIIPDSGYVFIDRDYSAQELRLLTHFAPGKLLQELETNPEADIHQIAAKIAGISRKEAKTLAFAVLYGAGVGKIAESLHMTVAEATRVKEQYLKALPEIKELTKRVQDAGRNRSFITTLGGRQYYAQKPAVVKGMWRSFEYKMTNYLIQGSAADATKQAMLDYCRKTKFGKLVLSVHDELVVQAPEEHIEAESALLEACMNGSFQNVLKYKVISTGSTGTNFAEASA